MWNERRWHKGRPGRKHTEEELVLIDDVGDAKVRRAKNDDERLNDAVEERDNKDEDRLRIDRAVVDHRWGV